MLKKNAKVKVRSGRYAGKEGKVQRVETTESGQVVYHVFLPAMGIYVPFYEEQILPFVAVAAVSAVADIADALSDSSFDYYEPESERWDNPDMDVESDRVENDGRSSQAQLSEILDHPVSFLNGYILEVDGKEINLGRSLDEAIRNSSAHIIARNRAAFDGRLGHLLAARPDLLPQVRAYAQGSAAVLPLEVKALADYAVLITEADFEIYRNAVVDAIGKRFPQLQFSDEEKAALAHQVWSEMVQYKDVLLKDLNAQLGNAVQSVIRAVDAVVARAQSQGLTAKSIDEPEDEATSTLSIEELLALHPPRQRGPTPEQVIQRTLQEELGDIGSRLEEASVREDAFRRQTLEFQRQLHEATQHQIELISQKQSADQSALQMALQAVASANQRAQEAQAALQRAQQEANDIRSEAKKTLERAEKALEDSKKAAAEAAATKAATPTTPEPAKATDAPKTAPAPAPAPPAPVAADEVEITNSQYEAKDENGKLRVFLGPDFASFAAQVYPETPVVSVLTEDMAAALNDLPPASKQVQIRALLKHPLDIKDLRMIIKKALENEGKAVRAALNAHLKNAGLGTLRTMYIWTGETTDDFVTISSVTNRAILAAYIYYLMSDKEPRRVPKNVLPSEDSQAAAPTVQAPAPAPAPASPTASATTPAPPPAAAYTETISRGLQHQIDTLYALVGDRKAKLLKCIDTIIGGPSPVDDKGKSLVRKALIDAGFSVERAAKPSELPPPDATGMRVIPDSAMYLIDEDMLLYSDAKSPLRPQDAFFLLTKKTPLHDHPILSGGLEFYPASTYKAAMCIQDHRDLLGMIYAGFAGGENEQASADAIKAFAVDKGFLKDCGKRIGSDAALAWGVQPPDKEAEPKAQSSSTATASTPDSSAAGPSPQPSAPMPPPVPPKPPFPVADPIKLRAVISAMSGNAKQKEKLEKAYTDLKTLARRLRPFYTQAGTVGLEWAPILRECGIFEEPTPPIHYMDSGVLTLRVRPDARELVLYLLTAPVDQQPSIASSIYFYGKIRVDADVKAARESKIALAALSCNILNEVALLINLALSPQIDPVMEEAAHNAEADRVLAMFDHFIEANRAGLEKYTIPSGSVAVSTAPPIPVAQELQWTKLPDNDKAYINGRLQTILAKSDAEWDKALSDLMQEVFPSASMAFKRRFEVHLLDRFANNPIDRYATLYWLAKKDANGVPRHKKITHLVFDFHPTDVSLPQDGKPGHIGDLQDTNSFDHEFFTFSGTWFKGSTTKPYGIINRCYPQPIPGEKDPDREKKIAHGWEQIWTDLQSLLEAGDFSSKVFNQAKYLFMEREPRRRAWARNLISLAMGYLPQPAELQSCSKDDPWIISVHDASDTNYQRDALVLRLFGDILIEESNRRKKRGLSWNRPQFSSYLQQRLTREALRFVAMYIFDTITVGADGLPLKARSEIAAFSAPETGVRGFAYLIYGRLYGVPVLSETDDFLTEVYVRIPGVASASEIFGENWRTGEKDTRTVKTRSRLDASGKTVPGKLISKRQVCVSTNSGMIRPDGTMEKDGIRQLELSQVVKYRGLDTLYIPFEDPDAARALVESLQRKLCGIGEDRDAAGNIISYAPDIHIGTEIEADAPQVDPTLLPTPELKDVLPPEPGDTQAPPVTAADLRVKMGGEVSHLDLLLGQAGAPKVENIFVIEPPDDADNRVQFTSMSQASEVVDAMLAAFLVFIADDIPFDFGEFYRWVIKTFKRKSGLMLVSAALEDGKGILVPLNPSDLPGKTKEQLAAYQEYLGQLYEWLNANAQEEESEEEVTSSDDGDTGEGEDVSEPSSLQPALMQDDIDALLSLEHPLLHRPEGKIIEPAGNAKLIRLLDAVSADLNSIQEAGKVFDIKQWFEQSFGLNNLLQLAFLADPVVLNFKQNRIESGLREQFSKQDIPFLLETLEASIQTAIVGKNMGMSRNYFGSAPAPTAVPPPAPAAVSTPGDEEIDLTHIFVSGDILNYEMPPGVLLGIDSGVTEPGDVRDFMQALAGEYTANPVTTKFLADWIQQIFVPIAAYKLLETAADGRPMEYTFLSKMPDVDLVSRERVPYDAIKQMADALEFMLKNWEEVELVQPSIMVTVSDPELPESHARAMANIRILSELLTQRITAIPDPQHIVVLLDVTDSRYFTRMIRGIMTWVAEVGYSSASPLLEDDENHKRAVKGLATKIRDLHDPRFRVWVDTASTSREIPVQIREDDGEEDGGDDGESSLPFAAKGSAPLLFPPPQVIHSEEDAQRLFPENISIFRIVLQKRISGTIPVLPSQYVWQRMVDSFREITQTDLTWKATNLAAWLSEVFEMTTLKAFQSPHIVSALQFDVTAVYNNESDFYQASAQALWAAMSEIIAPEDSATEEELADVPSPVGWLQQEAEKLESWPAEILLSSELSDGELNHIFLTVTFEDETETRTQLTIPSQKLPHPISRDGALYFLTILAHFGGNTRVEMLCHHRKVFQLGQLRQIYEFAGGTDKPSNPIGYCNAIDARLGLPLERPQRKSSSTLPDDLRVFQNVAGEWKENGESNVEKYIMIFPCSRVDGPDWDRIPPNKRDDVVMDASKITIAMIERLLHGGKFNLFCEWRSNHEAMGFDVEGESLRYATVQMVYADETQKPHIIKRAFDDAAFEILSGDFLAAKHFYLLCKDFSKDLPFSIPRKDDIMISTRKKNPATTGRPPVRMRTVERMGYNDVDDFEEDLQAVMREVPAGFVPRRQMLEARYGAASVLSIPDGRGETVPYESAYALVELDDLTCGVAWRDGTWVREEIPSALRMQLDTAAAAHLGRNIAFGKEPISIYVNTSPDASGPVIVDRSGYVLAGHQRLLSMHYAYRASNRADAVADAMCAAILQTGDVFGFNKKSIQSCFEPVLVRVVQTATEEESARLMQDFSRPSATRTGNPSVDFNLPQTQRRSRKLSGEFNTRTGKFKFDPDVEDNEPFAEDLSEEPVLSDDRDAYRLWLAGEMLGLAQGTVNEETLRRAEGILRKSKASGCFQKGEFERFKAILFQQPSPQSRYEIMPPESFPVPASTPSGVPLKTASTPAALPAAVPASKQLSEGEEKDLLFVQSSTPARLLDLVENSALPLGRHQLRAMAEHHLHMGNTDSLDLGTLRMQVAAGLQNLVGESTATPSSTGTKRTRKTAPQPSPETAEAERALAEAAAKTKADLAAAKKAADKKAEDERKEAEKLAKAVAEVAPTPPAATPKPAEAPQPAPDNKKGKKGAAAPKPEATVVLPPPAADKKGNVKVEMIKDKDGKEYPDFCLASLRELTGPKQVPVANISTSGLTNEKIAELLSNPISGQDLKAILVHLGAREEDRAWQCTREMTLEEWKEKKDSPEEAKKKATKQKEGKAYNPPTKPKNPGQLRRDLLGILALKGSCRKQTLIAYAYWLMSGKKTIPAWLIPSETAPKPPSAPDDAEEGKAEEGGTPAPAPTPRKGRGKKPEGATPAPAPAAEGGVPGADDVKGWKASEYVTDKENKGKDLLVEMMNTGLVGGKGKFLAEQMEAALAHIADVGLPTKGGETKKDWVKWELANFIQAALQKMGVPANNKDIAAARAQIAKKKKNQKVLEKGDLITVAEAEAAKAAAATPPAEPETIKGKGKGKDEGKKQQKKK